MSVFHNDMLAGSGSQGGGASSYQIARSLRFNSADSAYLSRTPSVAGNRKTWTWAGWVKRSGLGADQILFSAGPLSGSGDATGLFYLFFNSSNLLSFVLWTGPSSNLQVTSNAVYRDTSAWYHVVAVLDTDNATSSERVRLYVNGTRLTSLSSAQYPSSGATFSVNNTQGHNIGRYVWDGTLYLNGYLADVHFIDGQALDPTSFGQFDSNGVWQPKAYSGTYGTNGFRLDFSDNSNTTAATLGADRSGNGNNWTPNNFSVTAGAGNDSLVDSPTNYGTDTGAGGEVRGNYCTLNPLAVGSSGDLAPSNGNLDATGFSVSGNRNKSIVATVGVSSGKWYWEVAVTSVTNTPAVMIGIANKSDPVDLSYYPGYNSFGWTYYAANGNKNNNAQSGGQLSYGASYTAGDTIGIALDVDGGSLTFYKNGVSQGVAYSGLPAGTYYPAVGHGGSQQSFVASFNFGQRPFAYAAPSGFKALCTQNLPTPTIPNGRTAMDVVTDTGANILATAQAAIGGAADLYWIKDRANASNHQIIDAVRGGTLTIQTNTTNAETTYSAPSGSSVAWVWDAGSSTVTNTAGTITSQVRANASAGISIVSYTGNGGNATVGHGLGATPGLIIVKTRNTTRDWIIWTTGFTSAEYLLFTTAAKQTFSTQWGSLPTSSVFGVQDGTVNANGNTFIAYCFAPVSGFSAFGSYTGNGSADGVFVYTNHQPRWILIKRTDTTGNWYVWDTARDTFNVAGKELYPNLSNAEGTGTDIDILSNGFKIRATTADFNANNGTYIYASFASNPFAVSRAR